MLILPAIDLRGGECVRLLQGRFDAVTRYDADPFARAAAFRAAGAEALHVVDLDGAEVGEPRQHALIGEIARASGLKVQAGGGVRTRGDVARLLEAGASRAVVGSAAVRKPEDVVDWLQDFGPERIVLALDVRLTERGPEVLTHGWTEDSGVDLWTALDRLAEGAPKHVLVTDVARDGALTGPNLPLIEKITSRRPDLALQASGGVAELDDLAPLNAAGAAAAVVGKALYENRFTLEQAIARAR